MAAERTNTQLERGPIGQFHTAELKAISASFRAISGSNGAVVNGQKISGPQRTSTDMLRLNRALLTIHSASPNTFADWSLQNVLDAFVQELVQLLDVDVYVVVGEDAGESDSRLFSASRWSGPLNLPQQSEERRVILRELTQKAYSGEGELRFSLSQPELDPRLRDFMDGLGISALLVLPMEFQGHTIGTVKITDNYEGRAFTDRELFAAQLLANVTTSLLLNAQLSKELITTNASLQERNKELDAFAHTVSHDLKGPLSNMIVFGHLLNDSDHSMPAEDQKESVGYIIRSGYKMLEIIDEMLVLASIKKEEVEGEALDMAAILSEIQNRIAYLVEEHQAKITILSHWPRAWGKRSWVQQVWFNFITNAVKYGGRPPLIEIGATELADEMIRFWVRDNGRGLTRQQIQQLFIPFERLEAETASGHGLGLSIVKSIVEKLGGEVGVESEVGVGSSFYFTLPAIPEATSIGEGESNSTSKVLFAFD